MKELKKEMEEIAGKWDGDNPGYAEDQAMIAVDVLEKIKEIEELLRALNGDDEPIKDIPGFEGVINLLDDLSVIK